MGSSLLFVTQAYDPKDPNLGFTCAWVEAFAKQWSTVHVVCWRATRPSSSTIRVHVIPERGARRFFALLGLSWRLRKDVQSVFVHMISTVLAALGWWWRLLGWRVGLWYTHGSVSASLRLALMWTHIAFTANLQSLHLASPKICPVGHGIDLRMFCPDESVERRPQLLFVGRVTPRKDLERFLRMAARLHERVPTLCVVIAGAPRLQTDETYAEQMYALAMSLGLKDRVVWAGNVLGLELVNLYRSSALLFSSSKTGSVDKVVLEALACGTPVIATGNEYRDIPGVQVIDTDEAILAAALRMIELREPARVRSYLEKEASLPMLVDRIKLGLEGVGCERTRTMLR